VIIYFGKESLTAFKWYLAVKKTFDTFFALLEKWSQDCASFCDNLRIDDECRILAMDENDVDLML
jgi:hypothetical protein